MAPLYKISLRTASGHELGHITNSFGIGRTEPNRQNSQRYVKTLKSNVDTASQARLTKLTTTTKKHTNNFKLWCGRSYCRSSQRRSKLYNDIVSEDALIRTHGSLLEDVSTQTDAMCPLSTAAGNKTGHITNNFGIGRARP